VGFSQTRKAAGKIVGAADIIPDETPNSMISAQPASILVEARNLWFRPRKFRPQAGGIGPL